MTMTGEVFVVEVMLCGQPLSGSLVVLMGKDDGPIVERARSRVEKYFQWHLSGDLPELIFLHRATYFLGWLREFLSEKKKCHEPGSNG